MSSASTSCIGMSTGAVLTQIAATGSADRHLTHDPDTTFWRFKYAKHTPFALEAIEQNFQGSVSFGTSTQVTLNRTGDLIYYMYVVVDLPGIVAGTSDCGTGLNYPVVDQCDPCGDGPTPYLSCSTCTSTTTEDEDPDQDADCDFDSCTGIEGPYCLWINAIGQYIVERACLSIGGQQINALYNTYLFMWEEVAGKPGKRLTEMIGKRYTTAQLVEDSKFDRRLYVPLPWWFARSSGNALPLTSLQFHGVQVNVCFANLINCVQRNCTTTVPVRASDCAVLSSSMLAASLLTTYVYLDIEERDRFATGQFEQLVHQLQRYTTTTNQNQIRMQLNFNHPIIELIWAVRRECQELKNNWFNFGGEHGQDPITFVSLRLNNNSRFNSCEGRYFRLVQPYENHSLIPDSFVYSYSFALHPESAHPTGSINASRIDNIEMILDLQVPSSTDPNTTGNRTIIVYARNWNVLRFREGLGGVTYA